MSLIIRDKSALIYRVKFVFEDFLYFCPVGPAITDKSLLLLIPKMPQEVVG